MSKHHNIRNVTLNVMWLISLYSPRLSGDWLQAFLSVLFPNTVMRAWVWNVKHPAVGRVTYYQVLVGGHSKSMFAQICQLLTPFPPPLVRFLYRKNFKFSIDCSLLADPPSPSGRTYFLNGPLVSISCRNQTRPICAAPLT